mgnify:CR=1 FL=1
MNKFYIITNLLKDKTLETTYRIKKYIEEHGRECVLATPERILPEGTDCVLVLGGDGTLIRAARDMHTYDVPLLGINMGTLGYLTEVELQNVEEALDQLFDGDMQVQKRMMLRGIINEEEQHLAFNDIVVTRLGALRVIHFKLYVNGELLNTYHADGMIVSTPTGSTAYNLSAGGPIVEPTASIIVITPICSHALNTSSIVLSAEDEIMIEITPDREGNSQTVGLSFDGENNMEMKTGDRLVIRKSESETELLKLSDISFLERMRWKMKGN